MRRVSRLLGNSPLSGGTRLLRIGEVDVPLETIRPGHWFHLELGEQVFALPVLDCSPRENWIAFQLGAQYASWAATAATGSACRLSGPMGQAAPPACAGHRILLAADSTGLPALLFAARIGLPIHLALIGLTENEPAPVRLRPSRFLVRGLPAEAIAGIAVLENAGIPSRVCCQDPLPGCHQGDVAAMLSAYLAERSARWRWETTIQVYGESRTIAALERLELRAGRVQAITLPRTTDTAATD